MAKMFYSPAEAAEFLGVPESRLEELVRDGKLRHFRDGGNTNYKVDEIHSLAEQREPAKVNGRGLTPPPPSQEWVNKAADLEDGCESVCAGGPMSPEAIVDRADRIVARSEANVRMAKRVVIAAAIVVAFSIMSLVVSVIR